ncbi:arylamine N-acetyltransferase [Georgenia halophila]|uniref:Arylamine N-acetyltransferase n=1 Tax=Georgenia halophila TaxID=620889 RepID=A0ABP8LGM2_9MICO
MRPELVTAYLTRIGADRPARPDAGSLRDLQVRHAMTVPFENLDVHLGEPVVLDADALVDKVVTRRRGGFCYELNAAFGHLLAALGFPVSLHGAAVYAEDGVAGPPLAHMALRVDLEEPWLVDVGFGRGFALHPLRLDARGDQPDREGVFRLVELDDGDVLVTCDGVPKYRLESRARPLTDFEPTCWWTQTSSRSRFTQSLVCSILTEDGRTTLSGRHLVRTVDGRREQRTLTGDAEILDAYATHFGIALDQVPDQRYGTSVSW